MIGFIDAQKFPIIGIAKPKPTHQIIHTNITEKFSEGLLEPNKPVANKSTNIDTAHSFIKAPIIYMLVDCKAWVPTKVRVGTKSRLL